MAVSQRWCFASLVGRERGSSRQHHPEESHSRLSQGRVGCCAGMPDSPSMQCLGPSTCSNTMPVQSVQSHSRCLQAVCYSIPASYTPTPLAGTLTMCTSPLGTRSWLRSHVTAKMICTHKQTAPTLVVTGCGPYGTCMCVLGPTPPCFSHTACAGALQSSHHA